MQNYTRFDLKMDYKRDTENRDDINLHPSDYVQYLEEQVIKYRNEERQIADLNNKIADSLHKQELMFCDCGETSCHLDQEL